MKLYPAQQVDQESRVTVHFEEQACLASVSITGNKEKSLEKSLNNTSLVHPKLTCQGRGQESINICFLCFQAKGPQP